MKNHKQSTNEYVLILFGNISAYNIASILNGTRYKPICFTPFNTKKYSTPVAKFYKYSKHFHEIKFTKYAIEEDGFVDELIKYLKQLNSTIPIFTMTTNDTAIFFWLKNKDKLSEYITIESKNIESAFYKNRFFDLLEYQDIPHPKTWSSKEKVRKFPVVVKPAYKDYNNNFNKVFSAKSKIIRSENEFDLLSDFKIDELVFQEKIEFKEGSEFSWWGYRDEKDNIISVVAKHKAKYPDKMGRITNAMLIDNPVLQRLGEKIVRSIDYVGITDIQFIYDEPNDTYKVIEMNPRMWCSHEILPMNNINLIKYRVDNYYKSSDQYYDRNKYLEVLKGASEPPYKKEWFSILYNIKNFKLSKKFRFTEYYNLKDDNIITRILLYIFITAKFIGYFIKRVV